MTIAIIAMLAGSLGVYSIISGIQSPFSWAIEVGDEFHYSIAVGNSFSPGTGCYELPEYYSDLLKYDGEELIVHVDELPNVTGWISADSLLTKIITSSKVTCRLLNGTLIPDTYVHALVTPISQSFLPIDGWDLIDECFDNEFPSIDFDQTDTSTRYVASVMDDSLYLASRKLQSIWPNVASKRWEGWTDLSNGVPRLAKYRRAYPSCTFQISITVTMTLLVGV